MFGTDIQGWGQCLQGASPQLNKYHHMRQMCKTSLECDALCCSTVVVNLDASQIEPDLSSRVTGRWASPVPCPRWHSPWRWPVSASSLDSPRRLRWLVSLCPKPPAPFGSTCDMRRGPSPAVKTNVNTRGPGSLGGNV